MSSGEITCNLYSSGSVSSQDLTVEVDGGEIVVDATDNDIALFLSPLAAARLGRQLVELASQQAKEITETVGGK